VDFAGSKEAFHGGGEPGLWNAGRLAEAGWCIVVRVDAVADVTALLLGLVERGKEPFVVALLLRDLFQRAYARLPRYSPSLLPSRNTVVQNHGINPGGIGALHNLDH
jgi:hypothetical protein